MRSSSNIYLRFLCACLRGEGDSARALTETADWKWELLFRVANEQAVLPPVGIALTKHPEFIPPEVADFLLGVVELNRLRNQHILSELQAVARLLNEKGIEPVLLKGVAYLAGKVYPDAAARYLLDIDLLIPEEQLPRAAEILMKNGFQRDDTDPFGLFRHHHPPLWRGSISIELHHRLGLGPCESVLSAAEVFRSASSIDLDGIRVRLPSPTHLMTHLVMHSQLRHPYDERVWPPLRALCDVVQLDRCFGADVNWEDIGGRFRKASRYGLLVLHLLDIRDSLGFMTPLDLRLTMLLRLRRLHRKLLRRFPPLRYLDPIYMLSTLFSRRLLILRSLFTTPGGFKHLVTQLLERGVYQRFLQDFVQGRGH